MMIFVVVGAISVTVVIFTHQVVYALLLEVAHVAYLLGFAYAVYVIGGAWRAGNRDAKIILFGIIACFPFILLEIMKNSQFIGLDIPSMYFVEMGVLIFLLFQVYLLANHQAKSHKALEAMNINLEGIVNERTQELIAANVVRDRLLSVISHDVRSPLNSLQGMLDLYNTGMVTPAEFQEFSKKIQNHLGNTGLLVENILVWTTSQLKGARTVNDRFSLSELVNRNMQLFQSAATAKQITLASQVPDGMEITWDKNIVHLALRNLIANAIKYSHPGGRIDISAVKVGTKIHLTVKDYGIGIDPDTMNTILAHQRSTSREGTGKESGSGIGLSLVREFLVYAGGSLSAESVEGKGSQFTIEIPQ
jgi:signal transduction histidine kinase